MKGGVTSGVTYPLAVGELARRFHLKNLGGSSAGAIAAACAAAAEYRRRNSPGFDDMGGFTLLEDLPRWLGSHRRLAQLFRPDPPTRALFDLARKAASYRRLRLARVLLRCFRHWPGRLVLAILPGLVVLGLSCAAGLGFAPGWMPQPVGPLSRAWTSSTGILGGVFLSLGLAGIVLSRLLRGQLRAVVDNNFGLASGMADAPTGEAASLTPWLHTKLNEVAGLPPGRPLTFGDLWDAPVPPAGRTLLKANDHSIELKMVTTALTHGRPYVLPFQEESLYFRREDFEKLFPREVVRWMVDHSPPSGGDPGIDTSGWHRFPEARDLPVVVATRMSLSFPGLISAVPLGQIDPQRELAAGQRRRPETVWFSDGGISSNFPIHFFDAMVPRWPTIGINLRQFSPDPRADRGHRSQDNVYAIHRRSDGAGERWRRIHPGSPLGMMGRFFSAIVDTMQNWYDDSVLPLPGTRDRVVEIWQTKYEGGLNLDMDPLTVQRLAHKGRRAGQLMATRFSRPSTEDFRLGWDDHRWTRYRSVMAATARAHGQIHRTLYRSADWEALILRDATSPPFSGRFESARQAQQAHTATNELLDLHDDWLAMGTSVDPGLGPFRRPPQPGVKLGLRPLS